MASVIEPKKILAGALVLVLERRQSLLRALLLPACAYFVLELVRHSAAQQGVMLVAMLMQLLVHTLFAVTTHRILLLGTESVPPWGLLGWSRRESLFLLQVVTVSLCLFPVILVASLPTVGVFLAVPLGFWIVARLSLVFPAAAVDKPMTVGESWRLSAPHQLPLLFTVAVFPLLLGLPAVLLTRLPGGEMLVSVFELFVTVFVIAALSLSYSEVLRMAQE